MNLDRPEAPEPYQQLPPVPSFDLTSSSFEDGAAIPDLLAGSSGNQSPQLSWSGFPEGTKSFVISCFDPDAPTPAGYWHWTLVDVDPSVTTLDLGAANPGVELSSGFHVRGDSGARGYAGPYPPEGDRAHRYVFAVHALDVDTLGLDEDASPTSVAFEALFHTLARATLTGTYQR